MLAFYSAKHGSYWRAFNGLSVSDCNRTFFGEIGTKNPIRIAEPFQRNLPFFCTMHFVAAGGEFGDIVELTFLNFQVGTLENDR